MICRHDRLAESCNDCGFVANFERGEPTAVRAAREMGVTDHAPVNDSPAAREVADRDLRIERPDLGPNSYTPIRAGEPIPAALADLPRRDDAPPGKPSRRKPPE